MYKNLLGKQKEKKITEDTKNHPKKPLEMQKLPKQLSKIH